MLHGTGHTHKLHLLFARHERKNISAASARLPAAILAARLTERRHRVFCFWGTRLIALVAQIARFDSASHIADVAGRFALVAFFAEHIVRIEATTEPRRNCDVNRENGTDGVTGVGSRDCVRERFCPPFESDQM